MDITTKRKKSWESRKQTLHVIKNWYLEIDTQPCYTIYKLGRGKDGNPAKKCSAYFSSLENALNGLVERIAVHEVKAKEIKEFLTEMKAWKKRIAKAVGI